MIYNARVRFSLLLLSPALPGSKVWRCVPSLCSGLAASVLPTSPGFFALLRMTADAANDGRRRSHPERQRRGLPSVRPGTRAVLLKKNSRARLDGRLAGRNCGTRLRPVGVEGDGRRGRGGMRLGASMRWPWATVRGFLLEAIRSAATSSWTGSRWQRRSRLPRRGARCGRCRVRCQAGRSLAPPARGTQTACGRAPTSAPVP